MENKLFFYTSVTSWFVWWGTIYSLSYYHGILYIFKEGCLFHRTSINSTTDISYTLLVCVCCTTSKLVAIMIYRSSSLPSPFFLYLPLWLEIAIHLEYIHWICDAILNWIRSTLSNFPFFFVLYSLRLILILKFPYFNYLHNCHCL